MAYLTLNIGCGLDWWGDIRVDLRRLKSANIMADAQNLPFREGSFDMILASNVLEHLPRNPRDNLLEWSKLLKNGGLMFIYSPSRNYLQLIIEVVDKIQSLWLIFTNLADKGLIEAIRAYLSSVMHTLRWKKRMLGWGSGKGGHVWYIPLGEKIYMFGIPWQQLCIFTKILEDGWYVVKTISVREILNRYAFIVKVGKEVKRIPITIPGGPIKPGAEKYVNFGHRVRTKRRPR